LLKFGGVLRYGLCAAVAGPGRDRFRGDRTGSRDQRQDRVGTLGRCRRLPALVGRRWDRRLHGAPARSEDRQAGLHEADQLPDRKHRYAFFATASATLTATGRAKLEEYFSQTPAYSYHRRSYRQPRLGRLQPGPVGSSGAGRGGGGPVGRCGCGKRDGLRRKPACGVECDGSGHGEEPPRRSVSARRVDQMVLAVNPMTTFRMSRRLR
jgi:hypothetical protein